jgi:hypothetical protein
MTLLKQANEEAMADLYLDALRTLFDLSEKIEETPLEEFEEIEQTHG